MNDLITRFVTAIENIGSALQVIAAGQQQLPLGATPSATASDTAAAQPKATRSKAEAKADSKADSKAESKAKAEAEFKPKAEAEPKAEPAFDYEELKKAIIALAGAGSTGKEAALRILTDAGLERGQKASDADPAKWPGMYNEAVAALAKIKEDESFA